MFFYFYISPAQHMKSKVPFVYFTVKVLTFKACEFQDVYKTCSNYHCLSSCTAKLHVLYEEC